LGGGSIPPALAAASSAPPAAAVGKLSHAVGSSVETLREWADAEAADFELRARKQEAAVGTWARLRRELAVFLLWALELLEPAGERLGDAAARGERAVRERFARKAESEPAPEPEPDPATTVHWPPPSGRRSEPEPEPAPIRIPTVAYLVFAAGVLVGGVQMENTVLWGNASTVSMAVHGLGLYALGVALWQLVEPHLDRDG
jgi:hypothetical protein